MNKNNSLTKLVFFDMINSQKKVKGIHIKNFSKVWNVNLSKQSKK
jgi:hypothetical protein